MESRVKLWSLCRVLANKTRLQLLWALFEHDELCVRELQFLIGMSQSNASNQLKLLSISGLISFRREKMSVIYRAEPLHDDGLAAELLKGLKVCWKRSVPQETIIRCLTGFTHERRIEMVQAIAGGCANVSAAIEKTGMSGSAFSRHLIKLDRRGVVCRNGDRLLLGKPGSFFDKLLLDVATSVG